MTPTRCARSLRPIITATAAAANVWQDWLRFCHRLPRFCHRLHWVRRADLAAVRRRRVWRGGPTPASGRVEVLGERETNDGLEKFEAEEGAVVNNTLLNQAAEVGVVRAWLPVFEGLVVRSLVPVGATRLAAT